MRWLCYAMAVIFSLGGIAGYLIASIKIRDSIHLLPEVAEASAEPVETEASMAGSVIPGASGSGRSANVTDQARPCRVSGNTRLVRMEVTAYCPDVESCGANSIFVNGEYRNATHSGARVDRILPFFVAADPVVIPLGSVVIVDGYAGNQPVPVLDTGGAIKGNRLDVYFPERPDALEWGRRENVEVIIFDTTSRDEGDEHR